MLLKTYRKILVSFELVQNFEIFGLCDGESWKVNIAVTYHAGLIFIDPITIEEWNNVI